MSKQKRLERIQEKTSNIGFDFKNDKQIIDKIKEEIIEFKTEVSKNKRDLIKISEEKKYISNPNSEDLIEILESVFLFL